MTLNKIFTIGVTGITGSGTSTVAGILAELGGYVIEADKLAHDAMRSGQPAHDDIMACFGAEVLANGEIDRRALGALVFGKAAQMKKLEQIIHPRVIAKTQQLLAGCDSAFAVIDAPMLIESGLNKICHKTWLITSTDETRIQRITKRDAISRAHAEMRLKSRKSDAELSQHADAIIENNSNHAALAQKIEQLLGEENITI
ncbi:MAG: dephospho-CoA kinase [Defluviitaleaceae bacterium]|nr:dephospho-CoA kinase [Defluviitaleaceae bacterium]